MPRYSRQLLDRARNPRCAGAMADADVIGTADLHGRAPQATFFIVATGQVIQRCMFQAFGCGVLIVACSALAERTTNRTVADVAALEPDDVLAALGGIPRDKALCADVAVRALRHGLG